MRISTILNDPKFDEGTTLRGKKYYDIIAKFCPKIENLTLNEKTGTISGKVPGVKGNAKGLTYITKKRLKKLCVQEAEAIVSEMAQLRIGGQSFGAIRFNTGILKGGRKAGSIIKGATKKAVSIAKKALKTEGFC